MIAFFRRLFFHDFWLKLFSLVLAVLIWLTVSFAIQRGGGATQPPVLGLNFKQRPFVGLPVVLLSSAIDVHEIRVEPKTVDVTVQGDARTIDRLQPSDNRVLVDLTGIEAARDLRKRIDVSTPPGVSHVRVIPSEVQITIPQKR
jgi:YbbR domain-containing protein